MRASVMRISMLYYFQKKCLADSEISIIFPRELIFYSFMSYTDIMYLKNGVLTISYLFTFLSIFKCFSGFYFQLYLRSMTSLELHLRS